MTKHDFWHKLDIPELNNVLQAAMIPKELWDWCIEEGPGTFRMEWGK
jgi:hypothetical protein